MYTTCLHCTGDLGANTLLEFLPVGRRIAFDETKGRLWVICPSCAKWNLVPFDRRLETIESCERLFRSTVTRFATEHIGLARHPAGVDLIRVGPAVGEEFASWRFGESFRKRRRWALAAKGGVSAVFVGLWVQSDVSKLMAATTLWSGAMAVLGVGYGTWMGSWAGGAMAERRRLRLRAHHPQTGRKVRFKADGLKGAQFRIEQGVPWLEIGMGKLADPDATARFTGDAADAMAARVLGRLNAMHGTDAQLRGAVGQAALLMRNYQGGSLSDIAIGRAGMAGTWPLAKQAPDLALGLEMYANEEVERRVMAGELAFLERQWREADALAKIVDDLVLPDAVAGVDEASQPSAGD